jgi:hypothetical protein
MTRRRRLAFVVSLAAIALASAAATVGVAALVSPDAGPLPERATRPAAAVAGAQKTIVRAHVHPRPAGDARQTVIGFLTALKDGDYARACDLLLRADGCEEQLAATNAGVAEYRLVGSRVAGSEAVVEAIADGMDTRFTLLRRSARWWIASLDIG